MDNFNRLGLIEISNIESMVDKDVYEQLKKSPLLDKYKNVDYEKDGDIDYHNSLFSVTSFGEAFIEACIKKY